MTDLVLLLEHNSVNLQISVGIVGTEHKRGATDSLPLYMIHSGSGEMRPHK